MTAPLFNLNPAEAALEAQRMSWGMLQLPQNLRGIVDETTGVSPRDVVWESDPVKLYRYPSAGKAKAQPLLVSYALVNRPHMMDLQHDRSVLGALSRAGHDIYLIDWGYPDPADRFTSLGDYIFGYLHDCVEQVKKMTKSPQVNLVGVCQGGVFATCYAAAHPENVRNLITMVTPVDFQTPDNLLTKWALDSDADLTVKALGNVPGDVLNMSYLTLKPFRLNLQKYWSLLDVADNREGVENFLRMEQWIFDSPAQAGAAFAEFVRRFHQDNQLVKGTLEIDGVPIRLADLNMPILNIFARDDHLVPPDASRAMQEHVGTEDYTELEFPGGHIGLYVSGRSQKLVPPAISEWLADR